MAENEIEAWNQFAPFYQAAVGSQSDTVTYGFDIGTEEDFNLLGELKDKRLLDLGCGGGQNAVALAKRGARVIGVDFSSEQLRFARKLAEQEEVKLELRDGDLYDLAFLPADNVDIVISTLAFDHIDDLPRIFRAIHRVLKPRGLLVFSMRHPVNNMISHSKSADPYMLQRSYWTHEAIRESEEGGSTLTSYQHTFSDIYLGLTRAGYHVDNVLEPQPTPNAPRSMDWRDSYNRVPPTIIVRARKEGS